MAREWEEKEFHINRERRDEIPQQTDLTGLRADVERCLRERQKAPFIYRSCQTSHQMPWREEISSVHFGYEAIPTPIEFASDVEQTAIFAETMRLGKPAAKYVEKLEALRATRDFTKSK